MKILASDFDKTLYIDDMVNFEKNIVSINRFIKSGNIFIIVTGRSYFDIKILLNKYSIPYTYLICEDGAKIYNSNDYCIYTKMINSDIVSDIINLINKNKYNYLLDDGYNYTNNVNDCVKIDIPYNNWDNACTLLKQIKDNYNIEGYISEHYINITGASVNKKNALSTLCNIENLNNKLYVIGDDINDLEMIEYFEGVIMDKHSTILDKLNKPIVKYLYLYIEELSKD